MSYSQRIKTLAEADSLFVVARKRMHEHLNLCIDAMRALDITFDHEQRAELAEKARHENLVACFWADEAERVSRLVMEAREACD